jgi:hypothetical protein
MAPSALRRIAPDNPATFNPEASDDLMIERLDARGLNSRDVGWVIVGYGPPGGHRGASPAAKQDSKSRPGAFQRSPTIR